jgi:hypothetical protein
MFLVPAECVGDPGNQQSEGCRGSGGGRDYVTASRRHLPDHGKPQQVCAKPQGAEDGSFRLKLKRFPAPDPQGRGTGDHYCHEKYKQRK